MSNWRVSVSFTEGVRRTSLVLLALVTLVSLIGRLNPKIVLESREDPRGRSTFELRLIPDGTILAYRELLTQVPEGRVGLRIAPPAHASVGSRDAEVRFAPLQEWPSLFRSSLAGDAQLVVGEDDGMLRYQHPSGSFPSGRAFLSFAHRIEGLDRYLEQGGFRLPVAVPGPRKGFETTYRIIAPLEPPFMELTAELETRRDRAEFGKVDLPVAPNVQFSRELVTKPQPAIVLSAVATTPAHHQTILVVTLPLRTTSSADGTVRATSVGAVREGRTVSLNDPGAPLPEGVELGRSISLDAAPDSQDASAEGKRVVLGADGERIDLSDIELGRTVTLDDALPHVIPAARP